MADPQCALCPRPAPDAPVCTGCAGRTADRLREAADLWPALRDQVARQVRAGDPTPRAGRPAPPEPIRPGLGDPRDDQQAGWPTGLPVDLAASETADAVGNTATTWARVLAEEVGADPPTTMAALLRWLAGRCEWIRHQPWAGEALDELAAAAGTVWRVVDRPTVERRYLGPCGMPDGLTGNCPGDLHTRPGSPTAVCPDCGTGHDVAGRQHWLTGLVADTLYPAADLAAAYGVPAATIRQWASRGRIAQHGPDRMGRPLYRAGDVLELAARTPSKRERMAA